MSEHQHIPIPEIVKGRVPENIGMRPGTNVCCVCGERIPDVAVVLFDWERFLLRELEAYKE